MITIAVKSGSDSEIQNFLDKNHLDFRVINDKNGALSQQFKIGAYPTTFIYSQERELLFSDVGYTSTIGLWLRMWWAGI